MNTNTHYIETSSRSIRLGTLKETATGIWFVSEGKSYLTHSYESNDTTWLKLNPTSRKSYMVIKI